MTLGQKQNRIHASSSSGFIIPNLLIPGAVTWRKHGFVAGCMVTMSVRISQLLIDWNGNNVTEPIQSAPPDSWRLHFTLISSMRVMMDVG